MINNKRSHEVVSFEGMIHILQKRCQFAFMGGCYLLPTWAFGCDFPICLIIDS